MATESDADMLIFRALGPSQKSKAFFPFSPGPEVAASLFGPPFSQKKKETAEKSASPFFLQLPSGERGKQHSSCCRLKRLGACFV